MVILAVGSSCSGANVSDSPWQVIGLHVSSLHLRSCCNSSVPCWSRSSTL